MRWAKKHYTEKYCSSSWKTKGGGGGGGYLNTQKFKLKEDIRFIVNITNFF